MPRVHFVQKARKDNSVVKKGQPYYWWSTRITVGKSYLSQKHYSATQPRRSQLTSSEFLSQMYDIEDDIGALTADDVEDLKSDVSDIVDRIRELGDEQEEKKDNLPEGLQEGPTGELLQNRKEECDSMADELEGVDLDDYDGPEKVDADDDPSEAYTEWLEGKLDEIHSVSYGGE